MLDLRRRYVLLHVEHESVVVEVQLLHVVLQQLLRRQDCMLLWVYRTRSPCHLLLASEVGNEANHSHATPNLLLLVDSGGDLVAVRSLADGDLPFQALNQAWVVRLLFAVRC